MSGELLEARRKSHQKALLGLLLLCSAFGFLVALALSFFDLAAGFLGGVLVTLWLYFWARARRCESFERSLGPAILELCLKEQGLKRPSFELEKSQICADFGLRPGAFSLAQAGIFESPFGSAFDICISQEKENRADTIFYGIYLAPCGAGLKSRAEEFFGCSVLSGKDGLYIATGRDSVAASLKTPLLGAAKELGQKIAFLKEILEQNAIK